LLWIQAVKIYDIGATADGQLLAFEVSNLRIGRRGVCRVVRSIEGAKLLRKPKFLPWFRESVFCEFVFDGELFEAEEPYGDSSRYWIGPRPPRMLSQTKKVRDAFARW
jgi:hypothetical protein